MAKKKKKSASPRSRQRVLHLMAEGFESTPSVWLEQKATGLVYGCKVYDEDSEAAWAKVRDTFNAIEAFVTERNQRPKG